MALQLSLNVFNEKNRAQYHLLLRLHYAYGLRIVYRQVPPETFDLRNRICIYLVLPATHSISNDIMKYEWFYTKFTKNAVLFVVAAVKRRLTLHRYVSLQIVGVISLVLSLESMSILKSGSVVS